MENTQETKAENTQETKMETKKIRKRASEARQEVDKYLKEDAEKFIDFLLEQVDYAISKRWYDVVFNLSHKKICQLRSSNLKYRVEEEFKRLEYELKWITKKQMDEQKSEYKEPYDTSDDEDDYSDDDEDNEEHTYYPDDIFKVSIYF